MEWTMMEMALLTVQILTAGQVLILFTQELIAGQMMLKKVPVGMSA